MKISILAVMFLSASIMVGSSPGTFQGKIVQGPSTDTMGEWIFLRGVKGPLRRVEISHARITFEANSPTASRTAKPADALHVGTQVRIIATQDDLGEWKASAVEVLGPTTK